MEETGEDTMGEDSGGFPTLFLIMLRGGRGGADSSTEVPLPKSKL